MRELQRVTGAMVKVPEDQQSQGEEVTVEMFGNFMQTNLAQNRLRSFIAQGQLNGASGGSGGPMMGGGGQGGQAPGGGSGGAGGMGGGAGGAPSSLMGSGPGDYMGRGPGGPPGGQRMPGGPRGQ